MPESEKKMRAGVSVPDPNADSGVHRDSANLYGDEADIPTPTRLRRRASAKAGGKNGYDSGDGGRKAKVPKTAQRRKKKKLSKPEKVYRSVYDILSATGNDSVFKPVRMFGREIRFWPLYVLGLIALLAVGVMLNNSNLSVTQQKVTVVGLPDDMEEYHIIVLSDMNARRFGDSQSLLLRTINSIKYDAIFCMGDMVGKSGDAQPFYEFLEGLNRPELVYFICGDSDPGPYVDKPRNITGTLSQIVLEDWILGAIERGANYVDAPMKLPTKNVNVWVSPANMLNLETVSTVESWKDQTAQEESGVISGLQEDYDTLPMTDYRYQLMQKLYDAEINMTSTDIHISLCHEMVSDEFIYTSEDHDIDNDRYLPAPELIIGGHYCNGVWRLPFIGALYVPDDTLPRTGWFPAQSKIHGLSSVDETQVYITGGLGVNEAVKLMPFRLFNGPEISVLTLTSTLPENMLEAGR